MWASTLMSQLPSLGVHLSSSQSALLQRHLFNQRPRLDYESFMSRLNTGMTSYVQSHVLYQQHYPNVVPKLPGKSISLTSLSVHYSLYQ
jgi:hypothetical protein